MIVRLFAATFVFGAFACTNPLVGERDSSSCDLRTAGTPEPICTDYASVGVGQDSFKRTCEAKKGSVGASCNRTGALGGCNEKNTDRQDNDSTTWYFPAPDVKSVDDVKALCGSKTFVAP
jgi:hypothetical protein